jgi:hypothetical protein
MKLWQVATTVGVGVMASGSGALQVGAANYFYYEDFATKEVANYDDFKQSYNSDTDNLSGYVQYSFSGNYSFDSCSGGFTGLDAQWYILADTSGSNVQLGDRENLPDFTCTTGMTFYRAVVRRDLTPTIIDSIMNDDAAGTIFRGVIRLGSAAAAVGKTMYLQNAYAYLEIGYEFDTTYLFNYILSDQKFDGFANDGFTGATGRTTVQYVYTTAGNDTYYIINTNTSDIGTTRKKYAVNTDDVFFRGESVGSRMYYTRTGVDSFYFASAQTKFLQHFWNFSYLNSSNYQQPIDNVPEFEYEYEDCGWNAFNIPCFVNNGIAYVVNDAPVISDAFTLLNAGMKLGGQAFSIIGQFTDNNLFGVLVLGGLGITAVRWFLKQD